MWRRFLFWVGVALLVWFVATRPQSAAHIARGVGGVAITLATGVGTFLASLF
jgi:hypothetical protein